MIAKLGGIGEKIELLISQGDDFGPHEVTLQNSDGTPLDLTGANISGGLKKNLSDTTLAAIFAVTYTNPAAGIFTFGISKFNTEGLSASLDLNDPACLHLFDLKVALANGRREKIYYGPARVHASVSI